jgi:hypothetical protein
MIVMVEGAILLAKALRDPAQGGRHDTALSRPDPDDLLGLNSCGAAPNEKRPRDRSRGRLTSATKRDSA